MVLYVTRLWSFDGGGTLLYEGPSEVLNCFLQQIPLLRGMVEAEVVGIVQQDESRDGLS